MNDPRAIMLASVRLGEPAPLKEMTQTRCVGCRSPVWAMPSDFVLIEDGVDPVCMTCAALITVANHGDVQVERHPGQDAELRDLGYDAVAEGDRKMVVEISETNRALRARRRRQRAGDN